MAIALERYRLAHGEYPDSLDALAPQFIAKVPHDVIGGQPLHYRRTSDGQFVLYSVGWNETDDGGVVVQPEKSDAGMKLATLGIPKATGSGGIRGNKFQHPTSNIFMAQASRLSFRASRPKLRGTESTLFVK